MYKKALGKAGETFAVEYLEAKGYRIIETDYKLKFSQIDIIARDEWGVHFIEVKTRSDTGFGRPAEAVDKKKLHHIRNGAEFYIRKNKIDEPVIIDVFEILVNHIEGVE